MGCCGGAKRIIKGAARQAQRAMGISMSPPQLVEARAQHCRECEHAIACPSKPGRKCWCGRCGCRLPDKLEIKGESCPVGKWEAV